MSSTHQNFENKLDNCDNGDINNNVLNAKATDLYIISEKEKIENEKKERTPSPQISEEFIYSAFPSIVIKEADVLTRSIRPNNNKRKKSKLNDLLFQLEAKNKIEQNTFSPNHNKSHRVGNDSFSKNQNKFQSKNERIKNQVNSFSTDNIKTEEFLFTNRNKPQEKFPTNPKKNHYFYKEPKLAESSASAKSKDGLHGSKAKSRKLQPTERYTNLTTPQLQRRLVANARERSRVHALSNAFNLLRTTIPSYSSEQKLSKLTILRVAINYISALEEILAMDSSSSKKENNFTGFVDECTCILQTEYGRSKVLNCR